mgnify:CR=1 FL=1
MYLLSRKDFVSHKTMSNSWTVFNFLMALLTKGNFLSRGKNSAPDIASMVSINKQSTLSPTV